MVTPPDETTADPYAVIAALRAERDETLAREAARNNEYAERAAHQGATVEVLQAMAASPGDAKPVFEVIVRRARDLCDAYGASLAQAVDGSIVLRAYAGYDEAEAKGHEAAFPRPVAVDTMFGRAILARVPVQLPDVGTDQTYALREGTVRGGVRAQAAVPLMRGGEAIGAINITRQQTGEFSQAQIELLQVFANQAVIAITSAQTYRALEERTAALAQRNSEYGERIDQQSATIDVLKVMAASPGDAQPVFDLIVERARNLCEGYGATILEFDGKLLLHRASTGIDDDPAIRNAIIAAYPKAPARGWPIDLAVLERRLIIVDDYETEPNLDPALRNLTHKSAVSMPLMRGEVAIGALALGGRERGGFSDSQIELLKTFAEQAVIAISSAETYRALQTRTGDLQESLEYQTSISDVLKVISRSTFDLQPVLDTVVETAARLCDADMAGIGRREGGLIRGVAFYGYPPEYRAWIKSLGTMPLDRHIVGHRAALDGSVVHVHDVAAEPNYPTGSIALGKMRTSLGVPLQREGETVGSIVLARQRVEPFTDRQIELVSTFADQAVIAIENTRLMTEQREALERQSAMADILVAINASLGDLAPVFEVIVAKAVRLCDAAFGAIMLPDGERFRAVGLGSVPAAYAEYCRISPDYGRPTPGSLPGRMLAGDNVVHVPDVADAPAYPPNRAATNALVDLAGGRTLLGVALRKDRRLLGMITIVRQEVRPFSDRQIELLRNFADQAVIAMENARLLTEQREALEQQTATAEVLQVINASPGDLAPVFDAMLEKAMRLCDAAFGSLYTYNGESFHSAAHRGVPAAYAEFREKHPPVPASGSGTAELLETRKTLHVLDVKDRENYQTGHAYARAMVDLGGIRTVLSVPLVKEDALIGYIQIYRQEVRAFTCKQIALLENFAAQAVMAMENARLLTEQREALEQQTATAEVLRVINRHPGDLAPVFNTILVKAHTLCGAELGALGVFDGHFFRKVARYGYLGETDEFLSEAYPAITVHAPLLRGETIHIPDVMSYPFGEETAQIQAHAKPSGLRAWLEVPLWKDGTLLGSISGWRREPHAFSDKEIRLLENFAAQAVIAMENARLLTEQREALEQQTATAEVLQVINASPGKLEPVFETMLNKAIRLCDATYGHFRTYDGEGFPLAAVCGDPGLVDSTWANL
jgi:GAF domain-containing protein